MFLIRKNNLRYMKLNPIFFLVTFFLLFNFNSNSSESRAVLSVGNENAKVTVKVFSSLTCPHCANFHIKIFQKLKIDFVDSNKVKYEHHAFPLDLAALNAEKVLGCVENDEKKLKLLNELYKNQGSWASGSELTALTRKSLKLLIITD